MLEANIYLGPLQVDLKPTIAGNYRITFYFQEGSEVSLAGAQVGDYNGGAPIIPKIGENNTAVVVLKQSYLYGCTSWRNWWWRWPLIIRCFICLWESSINDDSYIIN